MPYAVGASAAAVALVLNLLVVRDLIFAPSAFIHWVLRIGVDAIQGAMAGGAASLEFKGAHDYVGWAVAGLCAPPIARKIRFGRPGSSEFSFEVQDFIDRLTSSLDGEITRASDQLKARIDRRLVNRLIANGITPLRLSEELLAVIRARRVLDTRIRDAEYLRDLVTHNDPEAQKLRLMIERARALSILRTVRYLARRWPAPRLPL